MLWQILNSNIKPMIGWKNESPVPLCTDVVSLVKLNYTTVCLSSFFFSIFLSLFCLLHLYGLVMKNVMDFGHNRF